MRKKVLGVLVSGRGSNLQAIVDAINSDRLVAKIGVVISDNPEANALRRLGGMNIPTAVVERKSYATKQEFEAALIAQLDLHHVELVLLAGFMRILTPMFTQHYAQRMFNIHPSILPNFKGLHTHEQALAAGVKVHGATVHGVTAELDHGPIVMQSSVPILADDTADTLAARVLKTEHQMYPQVVQWFVEDGLIWDETGIRLHPKLGAPAQWVFG